MKTIKNIKGVVTKVYAETFEHEAYNQIKKLADFEPYQNSKIRIMPDAHAGKGCTVGTTMTITDKITPNLVGVDIGCGMLTVKLKDTGPIDVVMLDKIINNVVPSGFNVHEKSQAKFDFDKLRCFKKADIQRAMLSIGSLGGGNHFIELSESENDGSKYLIIHTGSRKLGGDTCKYYQDLAFQNVNEMKKVRENLIKDLKKTGRERDIPAELKKIQKPKADKELAFLKGNDFDDYMNDMSIVQKFAAVNRGVIADLILRNARLVEDERFETIHNYIDFKRMILRKGAVSSEKGELLLIPINMRDGSLLCVGKGNEDWNYSAPHGAGRLMSRSQARKLLDINDFKDTMSDVYSTSVGTSTLDEAPEAYKTIDEIKGAITDTVDIIDVLKPLYNFKHSEDD